MKVKALPPIDTLRAIFEYDPETGIITWKVSPSKIVKVGSIAGGIHISGYRLICYKRKVYKASRIAYALYHSVDPQSHEVDHINRVRDDDRIANLRLVDKTTNTRNRNTFRNNTSSCTGVSYNSLEKRWKSYITVGYKRKHLGTFETFDEAVRARKEAESMMFQDVTTP